MNLVLRNYKLKHKAEVGRKHRSKQQKDQQLWREGGSGRKARQSEEMALMGSVTAGVDGEHQEEVRFPVCAEV